MGVGCGVGRGVFFAAGVCDVGFGAETLPEVCFVVVADFLLSEEFTVLFPLNCSSFWLSVFDKTLPLSTAAFGLVIVSDAGAGVGATLFAALAGGSGMTFSV